MFLFPILFHTIIYEASQGLYAVEQNWKWQKYCGKAAMQLWIKTDKCTQLEKSDWPQRHWGREADQTA